MNRSIFLVVGLLCSFTAMAQTTAEALDLSVPEQPNPYATDSTVQRDAPGKYYGDTSGKPAHKPLNDQAVVVDDGKAKVWGSLTTGIGYSKGYGTSHYNAAEMNVSKSFGDGDNPKTINLQINVEQSDGPGYRGRYPYFDHDNGYGPPR